MAKRPAFQFYPREYMTDEHVVLMSLEEQGAYVRLLCHQWLEGSVPAEIPELAKLCGVRPTRMRKIFAKISAKFVSTSDGRLVNDRLERARRETKEWLDTQADAGRRGAEKRWAAHADPKPEPIGSPSAKNDTVSVTASVTEEKEQHSVFANANPDAVRRWLESPIGGEQQLPDPEPTRGELIALARKQGFNADGTDADIIDVLIRKRVKPRDIAAAIVGLPILVKSGKYPIPAGQRLNMRMLYSRSKGGKMPAWVQAEDAYLAAENGKPSVSWASL